MQIDPNRFTEKAFSALQEAQAEARRRSHQQVEALHLLHALLEQEGGIATRLLEKLNITPGAVALTLQRELERLPAVTGSVEADKVYVTKGFSDAINKAEAEMKKLDDEYLSAEHLLIGVLEARDEKVDRLAKSFELSGKKVRDVLSEVRGVQRVTSQNPESTYESLQKYGQDLVDLARQGKLDPVIGRDDEIRRVIRNLSRKTKNNPVL
ncbi:MAG: Clp protease N-terminal domain-containing protein, partial [Opitutales bacterium]